MPDAEIARLEQLVASDPGAPAFSALAEAHRRAGDAKRAERVARAGLRARPDHVAGRVALGLALLDLGCVEEARRELTRALEVVPDHLLARRALAEPEAPEPQGPGAEGPLGWIAEREVEEALAQARADRDAMLDADQVAQRVLRNWDDEGDDAEATGLAGEKLPERHGRDEGAAEEGGAQGFGELASDSPFATRTVADLLERQGHHAQAAALRRGLAGAGRALPGARRERVIAALERWLGRATRPRRP